MPDIISPTTGCQRLGAVATALLLAGSTWAASEGGDEKALTLDAMRKEMVASAKYMIWDGDAFPATPKSWTYPPKSCQIEIVKEGARSGKKCLAFHADGGAWMGFGFSFTGWYPRDIGYDISNYKNLSFWVKVDAAPGKGPNRPNIKLMSPTDDKANESNTVDIENYAPGITDGKWHEVVIPIKHLLNKKFDPTMVWEISIGTWSQDNRTFDLYIDEIGVDNRED